jgi:plasmid stabilization system protein ParE
MAHRVVWSTRAAQDLDAIATYIGADSPAYAGIVLKKILSQTRVLEQFPRAGRKVPELNDEDIRELMIYKYRVIYQLHADHILVAAVVHGKQILQ